MRDSWVFVRRIALKYLPKASFRQVFSGHELHASGSLTQLLSNVLIPGGDGMELAQPQVWWKHRLAISRFCNLPCPSGTSEETLVHHHPLHATSTWKTSKRLAWYNIWVWFIPWLLHDYWRTQRLPAVFPACL